MKSDTYEQVNNAVLKWFTRRDRKCGFLGHLKSALKNAPFRVEIFGLKIVKKKSKNPKKSENRQKNPKIVKKIQKFGKIRKS